eukprot:297390-Pelagomonas_calceolata.AAC.1
MPGVLQGGHKATGGEGATAGAACNLHQCLGGYKATGGEATTAGAAGSAPSLRGADLSVGNTLRSALCAVLRSRLPTSVPWRDRPAGKGAGFVQFYAGVHQLSCAMPKLIHPLFAYVNRRDLLGHADMQDNRGAEFVRVHSYA